MHPTARLTFLSRRLSPALSGLLLLVTLARAQVAPTATPDAATLAKYDTNKNGVLDADERATLDADQRKAGAAVAAASSGSNAARAGDEVIALSPFEVVSDNKGYYGANTMSGTRFNSKLEDLGASITVMTKEQM